MLRKQWTFSRSKKYARHHSFRYDQACFRHCLFYDYMLDGLIFCTFDFPCYISQVCCYLLFASFLCKLRKQRWWIFDLQELTFTVKKCILFQICTPTSIPYTASRASEFFKICLLLSLTICIGVMAFVISNVTVSLNNEFCKKKKSHKTNFNIAIKCMWTI